MVLFVADVLVWLTLLALERLRLQYGRTAHATPLVTARLAAVTIVPGSINTGGAGIVIAVVLIALTAYTVIAHAYIVRRTPAIKQGSESRLRSATRRRNAKLRRQFAREQTGSKGATYREVRLTERALWDEARRIVTSWRLGAGAAAEVTSPLRVLRRCALVQIASRPRHRRSTQVRSVRRTSLTGALIGLVALLGGMTLAGAASAASTTIDDGYLLQGWRTASTGNPQFSFTSRFGAPDGGGAGALALTTGAGDSITFTTAGNDRPLSDFYRTTGAYYGYRSSASTAPAGEFPQFILDVDLGGPGDPATPVRLYYDPAAQRDAAGTIAVDLGVDHWIRFDYARGSVCAASAVPGVIAADQTDCRNGGDKSLRDVLESYPKASVSEFGFLQQSDGALAAAVDKLNVGDDVYNFEPTIGPATPAPLPSPTPERTATPTPGAPEPGHPSPPSSPWDSGSNHHRCTCG